MLFDRLRHRDEFGHLCRAGLGNPAFEEDAGLQSVFCIGVDRPKLLLERPGHREHLVQRQHVLQFLLEVLVPDHVLDVHRRELQMVLEGLAVLFPDGLRDSLLGSGRIGRPER